ncbi:hypothetical protein HK103_002567 [Boothiomyces macroporosus]|uniref:LITAF domain-containing protein n=1 Tax=Boothiomyces macroporosus TaxID=261099 RepID=A0AAD5U9C7_9FUNG|nr:hypothetical protein HK103_002567 [Boothiomyces macroporosus]
MDQSSNGQNSPIAPHIPSPNIQTILPEGYTPQVQLPPQEAHLTQPPQEPPQYAQQFPQPSQPYQPGFQNYQPGVQPIGVVNPQPGMPAADIKQSFQPAPQQTYQPQVYQPQQSAPITQVPGPQAPMTVMNTVFSEYSQPITCMNCKQQGMSIVEKTNGAATWIAACATCLLCWPCAWVPFVIDTCKDTNHRCANCGMVAGTKKMI